MNKRWNNRKTVNLPVKDYKRHGLSRHPLYSSYYTIIKRCYNPKHDGYKNYGERGIKVCEEWLNSYEEFYNWAINNGWKQSLSLDRIDVNGDYCPENCRWITMFEQQSNKRNSIILEYNGEKHTLTQWSKILNIGVTTLHNRYKQKWSVEDILSPTKHKSNHTSVP